MTIAPATPPARRLGVHVRADVGADVSKVVQQAAVVEVDGDEAACGNTPMGVENHRDGVLTERI